MIGLLALLAVVAVVGLAGVFAVAVLVKLAAAVLWVVTLPFRLLFWLLLPAAAPRRQAVWPASSPCCSSCRS